MSQENLRRYFRVTLSPQPLRVDMRIVKMSGKQVDYPLPPIPVFNLSANGLYLITRLEFKPSEDIVYSFQFTLFNEVIDRKGHIVSMRADRREGYVGYGVKFIGLEDEERVTQLSRLLNVLAVEQRKKSVLTGCVFFTDKELRGLFPRV